MSGTATKPAVTLDALGEEDVQRLLSQLKEREDAEANAAKAEREAQKAIVEDAVKLLALTPTREFKAPEGKAHGAQGWHVPVKVTVEGHGEIVGQLLVRVKSSIPK